MLQLRTVEEFYSDIISARLYEVIYAHLVIAVADEHLFSLMANLATAVGQLTGSETPANTYERCGQSRRTTSKSIQELQRLCHSSNMASGNATCQMARNQAKSKPTNQPHGVARTPTECARTRKRLRSLGGKRHTGMELSHDTQHTGGSVDLRCQAAKAFLGLSRRTGRDSHIPELETRLDLGLLPYEPHTCST